MNDLVRLSVDELRRRTEPPNRIIKAAIIYKAIGSIVLFLSAALILGIISDTETSDRIREFLVTTALNTEHVLIERTFLDLGMISSKNGALLASVAILYGLLEAAESIGLAMRRRWAEYLTFLATILLIPLEMTELFTKFTSTKLVLLIVNIALAVYLVVAKELFQVSKETRREELAGWLPESR